MTGMKEGAGDDPFATRSETEVTESTTDTEPINGHETTTQTQPAQLPMILRRESVQDGRDRVPLFLQKKTKDDERDALHELENRFDDNVALTDLREALMMIGLQHLDETERQLKEWGYGMTFQK